MDKKMLFDGNQADRQHTHRHKLHMYHHCINMMIRLRLNFIKFRLLLT